MPAIGEAEARPMDGTTTSVSPPWARLAAAVVLSVGLHSAALYFPGSPRAEASQPRAAITARLLPAVRPSAAPAERASPERSAPERAVPERAAPAAASAAPESSPPRGVLPEPRYYPAAQLDRPPRPLEAIAPEYPGAAKPGKGRVALRVRINERGGVDDVAVLQADPEGVFERSALAAFSAARFAPGTLNGVAVRSQIDVEVEYLPPKGTPFDPLARSGAGY